MFLKDKRKKKFIQITYIALCLKTFTQGCKGNLFLTATKGVHLFLYSSSNRNVFSLNEGSEIMFQKLFLVLILLRNINEM